MTNSFEEISKSIASQNGKTDANLANDALHLGGIAAEDYATKAWVRAYHGDQETILRQLIAEQDAAMLSAAKEYANSLVRNQDFSGFAEVTDLQALNKNLTDKINADIAAQKQYTDSKTSAIVSDVNSNFADVNSAINQLNNGLNNSVSSLTNSINGLDDRMDDVEENIDELFQSVSSGKSLIAEAITDKGVTTSANASYSTMANNIRQINSTYDPGQIIVIPDGYMDTSDATATADKILQGYTAYANGNKIHGTYVPSGGGSAGGVVLGTDEVVAKKIYGEAGVLTGNKLNVDGFNLNINYSTQIAITLVGDDYVIADRKLTENVSGEIVIYNIDKQKIYHADPNSKYSYTYEELGLQGEVRCIAASPISTKADDVDYTQITIGTSVAIYTYLFRRSGNGMIYTGEKITINNPCNDYNSIAYANTSPDTFAYYSAENIHIVKILWSLSTCIETANESVDLHGDNVSALFRFSPSDRFLMYESWGTTYVSRSNVMLLDNFYFITKQTLSTDTEDTESVSWHHGQILINSKDDFAIIFGLPYKVSYDLSAKTLTFVKLSENKVIPFNRFYNESCYAVFSKDDKYVYAVSFQDGAVDEDMYLLGCYKVDLLNLETQWQLVSNLLPVSPNGDMPTIDIVNNKVFCLSRTVNTGAGFYYYYADPNVKEIIGLQYNGETYQRLIR